MSGARSQQLSDTAIRLRFFKWYVDYPTTSRPEAYHTTSASKRGESSILAVATEEGTVDIINTTRRRDWDPGMHFFLSYPGEIPELGL